MDFDLILLDPSTCTYDRHVYNISMTSSDQQCAALVVTVAEPELRGPAGAADAARA